MVRLAGDRVVLVLPFADLVVGHEVERRGRAIRVLLARKHRRQVAAHQRLRLVVALADFFLRPGNVYLRQPQ